MGIWDGHDSGAALIEDNRIVFAANEERYTRRKLEIAFPANAIQDALRIAGIKADEIDLVAYSTTDIAKTFTRIFPKAKESYYMFRRRKIPKPLFEKERRMFKYAMTSFGSAPLTKTLSEASIRSNLKHLGLEKAKLVGVAHHDAHAAGAAYASGFKNGLVITLDGVGDGLSGSVNALENNTLQKKLKVPAKDSIGVFYEQVTTILGMRELEDEGKIMAMADYSYPFPFESNKLKDFFSVTKNGIKARFGPLKQFSLLNKISWAMPREQFAYMAQQVLENMLAKFFEMEMNEQGFDKVAYAGGVASNVKANMRIRQLDSLKNMFVFPHMGDGGIALGAAMYANNMLNGVASYDFNAYLGSEFSDQDIEDALKASGLQYNEELDVSKHAAELIENDEYIFWFQDRMEFGPRALGNRSIVAKASSEKVKDMLNMHVKKREWFQPFAPSILESDANNLLEGVKYIEKFMTGAYKIKPTSYSLMTSVMHVDKTARPQMVGKENKKYMELIENVKKLNGAGVVLNTSFNIHGEPIVRTPEDAIRTMKATKTKNMFLGNFYVQDKGV